MNAIGRWIRRLALPAAAVVLAAAGAVPLWAQETAEPAAKASWVLGYALVFLAIALGLTAVCRPGNRSSEVRIEE